MSKVRGRITYTISGEVADLEDFQNEIEESGQDQILTTLQKYGVEVESSPTIVDLDYRQD